MTRQALDLGSQNATTGIYAKSYTETSIDMIILNEREIVQMTSAGKLTVIEATGYTKTYVRTGDNIKLGTPIIEQILNGGFEDDFDNWTQGGTPDILTDNPHSGSQFSGFVGTESIEQTLQSPIPVADLLTALRKYRVMSVTPHKIAAKLTHYTCKLVRLHEPVTAGILKFWYCIEVPIDYGTMDCQFKVTVTYTDATTDVINYDITEGFDASGYSDWTESDITSNLDTGKTISKIKIERVSGSGDLYVDDVSLVV